MKCCTRCGETRLNTAFQRSTRNADGLQAWCRACHREYSREWRSRPAVREHRKAAARARYTPERRKDSVLRSLYGMTLEQYRARLAEQNGNCLVCRLPLDGGKHTHVDHNHTTGAVRGLLCSLCNKGIGCLRDDPSLLRTAANYLEEAAK